MEQEFDKPIEEQSIEFIIDTVDSFSHNMRDISIRLWKSRKQMAEYMFKPKKVEKFKKKFIKLNSEREKSYDEFCWYLAEMNRRVEEGVKLDKVDKKIYHNAKCVYKQTHHDFGYYGG